MLPVGIWPQDVTLSPSSQPRQPRSVSAIKAGFVDFINQHALGVPGRHEPKQKERGETLVFAKPLNPTRNHSQYDKKKVFMALG
jgi:hypothetical protein